MVRTCCVYKCHNRDDAKGKLKGLSFFRFPKESHKRKLWIRAVNRTNFTPNEHTCICSEHFVSGWHSYDHTDVNYVPTLFTYKEVPCDPERHDRIKRRNLQKEFDENKEQQKKLEEKSKEFSLFSHSYCKAEEIEEKKYTNSEHMETEDDIETMICFNAVSVVFIVAAKRTAFGTYGGKLVKSSATDLMEVASKAALETGKVNPELVNSVIVGNVLQSSSADGIYLARHVGLKCGIPIPVPALTVNRLCGSGFQAVINAAQEIMLGETQIALAGGSDNMTQAPYSVRDIRFGTRLGMDLKLEDSLWAALTDTYTGFPMAITAENLAQQYNISRLDCDEYALTTQKRWKAAQDAGVFKAEIAPMTVKGKKGKESFEVDEHPRPQSTPESLAKLPAVFKKDGTVTAGNASGVCDGAAALIVASEEAVKQHNLTPLARLVSYGISGCDPKIMGIGPAPSSRAALQAAGKDVKDMDIVEVNEAFAPQYLAVEKELGLNRDITNMNGGAIALGHPLAASGARITGHLAHELHRQNKKLALGTACIGGGQGIAVILEKC